jgi:caa(3)-type oxidase subunit IV
MSIQSIGQVLRIGWIVIIALLILTIIEFIVALALSGSLQLGVLVILALIKSALIVQYFMHFGQLWKFITNLWWGILIPSEEEE